MANAEQPTRRTRHMETKTFAMQQWIREENMLLKAIGTQNNAADHFSKALGQMKFYEQTDLLMGRTKPNNQSATHSKNVGQAKTSPTQKSLNKNI